MVDTLASSAASPAIGTPEWWLPRLNARLDARATQVRRYDDYYSGRHRLAFSTSRFREAFGNLFREFADDWCAPVVDAVEERLAIEGFRFGPADQGADQDAWRIWQANHLDADSQIGHVEAFVQGTSYVLVWEGEDDSTPEITVESPAETTVAFVAGSRRKRAAALKRWKDDDGHLLATLYLPGYLYKFRSSRVVDDFMDSTQITFERREVDNEPWPLPNPLGVVPVVPLPNQPRLRGEGESEIRRVIPVQDAVNKLIADMLVASEFAGFPQRYATGIELPGEGEESNEVFKHLKAAVDRFWAFASTETKVGQFQVADLDNYVKAVEMLVQHIASQTRTPPHYFFLRGEFPSGDSIKAAEAGLVSKARRRMRHFGEGWEEVMRLAFQVIGDEERANYAAAETLWADPESRTESQHIDAVVKKYAGLGIPQRQAWEDANYTQQQIERMEQMREDGAPTGDKDDNPSNPIPA